MLPQCCQALPVLPVLYSYERLGQVSFSRMLVVPRNRQYVFSFPDLSNQENSALKSLSLQFAAIASGYFYRYLKLLRISEKCILFLVVRVTPAKTQSCPTLHHLQMPQLALGGHLHLQNQKEQLAGFPLDCSNKAFRPTLDVLPRWLQGHVY